MLPRSLWRYEMVLMNNFFAKLADFFFPGRTEDRARDDEILRTLRDRRVTDLGPSMGSIHSYAIPIWVRLSDGTKLPFRGYVGSEFSLESIPVGCVVIAPGLLYGEADSDGTDPRD